MTLFTVLLRLARELDEVFESTATGGSATTLVDTSNLEAADYWNGGTLFLKAGPRAPATVVPTDWALTTSTLTIPTGTAITTSSTYLLLHAKWPRAMLVQAVNDALGKQLLVAENETLAVSSTARKYTLPTGVSDVIKVEYGDDSTGWKECNTWKPGVDCIRFYGTKLPSSGKLLLTYRVHHADVSADTDVIDAGINLDLLHLDAMASLFGKRYQATKQAEDKKAADEWAGKAEQQRNRRPQPSPAPRYSGW